MHTSVADHGSCWMAAVGCGYTPQLVKSFRAKPDAAADDDDADDDDDNHDTLFVEYGSFVSNH